MPDPLLQALDAEVQAHPDLAARLLEARRELNISDDGIES